MGQTLSLFSQLFPPVSHFSVHDIPDLTGRIALVTGGNAGIGKETVRALLEHNATVYLAARSRSKAEETILELKQSIGKEAQFLLCDLASMESVRGAAQEFMSKETELHMLFNNGCVSVCLSFPFISFSFYASCLLSLLLVREWFTLWVCVCSSRLRLFFEPVIVFAFVALALAYALRGSSRLNMCSSRFRLRLRFRSSAYSSSRPTFNCFCWFASVSGWRPRRAAPAVSSPRRSSLRDVRAHNVFTPSLAQSS